MNREASCVQVAEDNNISLNDLFLWNSFLNPACTNLLAGDEVCISSPQVQPTPTTLATTTTPIQKRDYATETAKVPGPLPFGTTRKCGRYYEVQRGDYCDSIADRFSIDYQLFKDINPNINLACTNLVPGLYYCVSPTRDWNQTATTTSTTIYPTPPAPTTSGATSNCYQVCFIPYLTFGTHTDLDIVVRCPGRRHL